MRCDTCRYWDREARSDPSPDDDADDVEGGCHVLPPVLNIVALHLAADRCEDELEVYEAAARMSQWCFPVTQGCDWCGQWAGKTKATREDAK